MWIWMQHFTSRQPFKHVYHTWIMKILRCRQSNITTLFFCTTAIWLCNDGTTNKNLITLPILRFVQQLNNQLPCFFCWCALFLFLIPRTLYCWGVWAAGSTGLRRRCRYVTRLFVRPIFISKERNFFGVSSGWLLGVLRKVFSLEFVFVIVVDHFEMFTGERMMQSKGAAMWQIIFAGLTLISIGLVNFWINIWFRPENLF